jgi:type VI secretion system protein
MFISYGNRIKRGKSSTGYSLFLLLVLIGSGGCSTGLFKPRIALRELHFEVAANANDTTPFAVDIVAVSDEDVLKKLQLINAAQWFDPQSNLKRDYPQALMVWNYELTPNSSLAPDPEFAGQKAQGLLLFANYKTAGAHRLRLEKYKKASIAFAAGDISVDAAP